MSDNPIILKTDDPLFQKRETWLKKKLDEGLKRPFISFSEAVGQYGIGVYFIYSDQELLYIGMTERPGKNRIKEIVSSFQKHTFNRKLMAEHFRGLNYNMHVLSAKNFKRDWIDTGELTLDEFKAAQQAVNARIKGHLRFKFYEFNYFDIGALEHYAIATLRPLYND